METLSPNDGHNRIILKDVATVFFITRISIYMLSIVAYLLYQVDLLPDNFLWMGITPSDSTILRVWERWDGVHYLSILQQGYTYFRPGILNTAYFPLYPLLGYLVNSVIQNPAISLLLVSNAASFCGLIFAYKLADLEYGQEVARRAIFYLSIFPYAFIFVGMYTESLFLLNLAATLYYARRKMWGHAAVWGILLTATRLVGIAVVPALLWEYMSQRNWEWKRIDVKILSIAAMALGLIAYMTYTYFVMGDFFSFAHSSTLGWNRHPEWPWIMWTNYVGTMEQSKNLMILFTGCFAVFGVVLALLSIGRLRPMYAILAVLLVAIPLSSNQVGGIPRYLLTNLPLFFFLAKVGNNRVAHMGMTVLFLLYLALFTSLHANWSWVG